MTETTFDAVRAVQLGAVRPRGPRAVHVYALATYAAWVRDLPAAGDRFAPGAFGENIAVEGQTEAGVCIGDRFDLGSGQVELSQARQPCWKLNLHFGIPDMARRAQDSCRTGWYLRVLAPGEVVAGDRLVLTARPNPGWPLSRVWRILYRDQPAEAQLREFVALKGLLVSWQALARRRLETRGNQGLVAPVGGFIRQLPFRACDGASRVPRDRMRPSVSTVSRSTRPAWRKVSRNRPASAPSPFSRRLVTSPARIFSRNSAGSGSKDAATTPASTSNPCAVMVTAIINRASSCWRRRWWRNGWPPRR